VAEEKKKRRTCHGCDTSEGLKDDEVDEGINLLWKNAVTRNG
jgi:hypothetical protein